MEIVKKDAEIIKAPILYDSDNHSNDVDHNHQ